MKRFILFIILCLPLSAIAQTTSFNKLMDKYSSMQDCTTIIMEQEMLRSMGVTSGVDSVLVVSVESEVLLDKFKEDVALATKGYSVMMTVNSGGEMVKIVSRSEGGKISEMIVLTISSDEGVAIRVTGNNLSLSEAMTLIDM
ncbi:MAG: DUF4252 domain-containing protein [Alistipes sp.]|nr:DUF4252 domain-containing protein [Alistipes sp.]